MLSRTGAFLLLLFGCGSAMPQESAPIDLTGRYLFAGDGSIVSARTVGSDRVSEPIGAIEGTYTPFSDLFKPPRALTGSLIGRSFVAEVRLEGEWAIDQMVNDGDLLRIGSEAGSASVIVDRAVGGFRFVDPDDGTAFLVDATGATRFRIACAIDLAGQKMLTVTTLDGASPGTQASSSQNLAGGSGAIAGFFVELSSGVLRKSNAAVLIERYRAAIPANALYLDLDDAYVRPGDFIEYDLAMANLAQPIGGFQAFLAEVDPNAVQAYVTGTYTPLPFPSGRFWGDPIPASLFLASAIPFGGALVQTDAELARLRFAASGHGAASLFIRPNNGGGFDTAFYDDLGIFYPPTRMESNIVLVDGVAPELSGLSVLQDGEDALSCGLAPGDFTVCVTGADDLSGLAKRPEIVIDMPPLGPGPEDLHPPTYSEVAPNTFGADATLAEPLVGEARVQVALTDRAGNVATFSSAPIRPAATLEGIVDLQNFEANPASWPVSLEVRLPGGGSLVASIVPLSPTGAFSARLPLFDGTYDVSVKAAHWLRRTQPSVIVASGSASGLFFSLENGDCSDDNEIDIGDFAILSAAFGSFEGAPNWDPMADLNGDEEVDIGDYAILSANFGMAGD